MPSLYPRRKPGYHFQCLVGRIDEFSNSHQYRPAHVSFNLIGYCSWTYSLYPGNTGSTGTATGPAYPRYRPAGLLYLLLSFFFIPFSLIYFNRDAVAVTELTYQRIENNHRSFFTVIAKTFENQSVSTRSVYDEENAAEPSQIYSGISQKQCIDH